jgi:hypothetical protein
MYFMACFYVKAFINGKVFRFIANTIMFVGLVFIVKFWIEKTTL